MRRRTLDVRDLPQILHALLAGHGLLRALAGAGVGAGALAANRQAAAMPHAAVAADVPQPGDVLRRPAAATGLRPRSPCPAAPPAGPTRPRAGRGPGPADRRPPCGTARGRSSARRRTGTSARSPSADHSECQHPTNAAYNQLPSADLRLNVRLGTRRRSARGTRAHPASRQALDLTTLTLPLLVPRVAADHEHHAPATDDLAVLANPLDAGTDFHGITLTRSLADSDKALQYKPWPHDSHKAPRHEISRLGSRQPESATCSTWLRP